MPLAISVSLTPRLSGSGFFIYPPFLADFFYGDIKLMKNDIAKSNKIDVEDYEKALERVYQDMMSRHSDPEILRMREDNKKSILGNGYLLRSKDISNLKQVYRNSTSKGDRIGAWDHKPAMKKILPSYYRKDEINSSGRQPVVFGGKIPGDNSYIYDHDFWGNISYGYTLAAAGYNDLVTKGGAVTDDFGQWGVERLKHLDWVDFDSKDSPMVEIGIDLFNKYGAKLTKEDLQREIWENRDKLRRYDEKNLETRSVKAKAGEDLAQIGDKHGISKEDMVQNLQRDAQINPAYASFNENMSLKEGTRINLPQRADRQVALQSPKPDEKSVTPLSGDKLSAIAKPEEYSVEENSILEALKKHNNPDEDILYKPVEQITEEELKSGMRHYLYENKDIRRKKQADEMQGKWYDHYYGTGAVKRDEFGRQLVSEPKKAQAQERSELRLNGGMTLNQAYEAVAKQAAPLGVKSLQKGLNSFGDGSALKEDGILGAKTTSRTKEALSRYGVDKVKQSIGYGGLSNVMEQKRQQPFEKETLQQTMSSIRPNDGGSFLQKGLNEIGQKVSGYEALKEDNDIGDKTTSAFNHLKDEKEDEIKSYVRSSYASENHDDEPDEEDF